jgi:hypothetical protein
MNICLHCLGLFLNAQALNETITMNDKFERNAEGSSHDLSEGITRIFGEGIKENHKMKCQNSQTLGQVVQDLLKMKPMCQPLHSGIWLTFK